MSVGDQLLAASKEITRLEQEKNRYLTALEAIMKHMEYVAYPHNIYNQHGEIKLSTVYNIAKRAVEEK